MKPKKIQQQHDFILPNSETFQFDFLTQLICDTQNLNTEIKDEWENMYAFFDEFPEHAENFNSKFDLNNKFLIDSFQKVYNQLMFHNTTGNLAELYSFPLFLKRNLLGLLSYIFYLICFIRYFLKISLLWMFFV